METNFKGDCSHEWKVKNFLTHSLLQSATFPKESSRFKWKLYLKRKDSIDPDTCSLLLKLDSAPRGIIWAKYSLVFKSKDEEELFQVKDIIAIFKNHGSSSLWRMSEHSCIEKLPSILRKFCGQCCELSKDVTSDTLFIEIKIRAIVTEFEPKLTTVSDFTYHTCKLAEDIASNFNDDTFSDITIVVGKSEFKAHRIILAARSSVFARMLQSDFLEKNSGLISITDFTAETVKEFIQFIYSGNVKYSDFDMASELLRAAKMYDIVDLHKLCVDYLISVVDDESVLDAFLLGDMYAPDLKKYAMDYFIIHLGNHDSSDFQNIEKLRPNLLTELLLKMVKKCSANAALGNLANTVDPWGEDSDYPFWKSAW